MTTTASFSDHGSCPRTCSARRAIAAVPEDCSSVTGTPPLGRDDRHMIDPPPGRRAHRGSPSSAAGRCRVLTWTPCGGPWSSGEAPRRGKTRLAPLTGGGPGLHADLVLALLADTVAAARDCAAVADVLVVTDDARAAATVRALGARTVPDEPDRGLNPALAHGARASGGDAVAALSSDLPALRPAELAAALAAAGSRRAASSPTPRARGPRC
jgi:hypothetical protein